MEAKKFPILMYHRVEDSLYMNPQGLKLSGEYCSLERFRSHMERLAKEFQVWPMGQIINYLRNQKQLPANVAALTFDDGTRDQIEVTFPVLREFGFPAMFAVMAAPLAEKIPPTFKMQLITGGGVPIDDVANKYFPDTLDRIAPEFAEKYKSGIQVPPERYIGEQFEIVRQMKYLLNYLLPASLKDLIADELFSSVFGESGEKEIVAKMFFSIQDIRQLAGAGMEITCHSANHYNLSTIEEGERVITEVCVSKDIIEKTTAVPVSYFVYPGGGKEGYTPEITKLVSKHYDAAFITGTQKELCGTADNLYELPRLHEKYF